MAGLVLAIHVFHFSRMEGGWAYLITNRRNGALYTGRDEQPARRAFVHRKGLCAGFAKQYGLKRLVYYDRFDDIAP
jgi:putative endonuclease